MCLDVDGSSVDLWDCKTADSGNTNQQFVYSKEKQGISTGSGAAKACLTAADDGGGAEVSLLDAGAGRAPELLRGVASLVRSDGTTRVSATALELAQVIEALPPSELRLAALCHSGHLAPSHCHRLGMAFLGCSHHQEDSRWDSHPRCRTD